MGTNRNYVNSVHVTSGVNLTDEATLSIGNMAAGDVAVVNVKTGAVVPTNAAGAALADSDLVQIVSGLVGGGLRRSKAFSRNSLSDATAKPYAAGTSQVTYIGFNGTDGTIPFSVSTEYRMDIDIKHRQSIRGLKIGGDSIYITTPASDVTPASVAMQFAELFDVRKSNGTYKNYKGKFVDIDVILEGTEGVSDNAVTVVKGSPIVTFATAATYGTGTLYAVGDLIRIGGAASTDSCYEVKEVDGLKITLNRAYSGISEVVSAANSANISAVTNSGLRVTGKTQVRNGIDTFEWLKFNALMGGGEMNSGIAPVIVRTTVKATPGSGVTGQVIDAEYFAEGYEGVQSRRNFWDKAINPDSMVSESALYGTVNLRFLSFADGGLQDKRSFPCATNIFIPQISNPAVSGEQANDANDDFLHILSGVTGIPLTLD